MVEERRILVIVIWTPSLVALCWATVPFFWGVIPSKTGCFCTIHAGAMLFEVYPDQLFRPSMHKLHQKTILILEDKQQSADTQRKNSRKKRKPHPPVINYKWKQQYFPSLSRKTNSLYRSSSSRRRFPFQTFTNLPIFIFIFIICCRKTSNCKACPNHMVNLNFTQKVLFSPIFPFLLSQYL